MTFHANGALCVMVEALCKRTA